MTMAASLQTSSSKAVFTAWYGGGSHVFDCIPPQAAPMQALHQSWDGALLLWKETPKVYSCGALLTELCMLYTPHLVDSGLRDSVPSGVRPRRRLPAKPALHCTPTQSRQPVMAVHAPGHK